jgi:hypothetical protein
VHGAPSAACSDARRSVARADDGASRPRCRRKTTLFAPLRRLGDRAQLQRQRRIGLRAAVRTQHKLPCAACAAQQARRSFAGARIIARLVLACHVGAQRLHALFESICN